MWSPWISRKRQKPQRYSWITSLILFTHLYKLTIPAQHLRNNTRHSYGVCINNIIALPHVFYPTHNTLCTQNLSCNLPKCQAQIASLWQWVNRIQQNIHLWNFLNTDIIVECYLKKMLLKLWCKIIIVSNKMVVAH